jgi:hypothetical protein
MQGTNHLLSEEMRRWREQRCMPVTGKNENVVRQEGRRL